MNILALSIFFTIVAVIILGYIVWNIPDRKYTKHELDEMEADYQDFLEQNRKRK